MFLTKCFKLFKKQCKVLHYYLLKHKIHNNKCLNVILVQPSHTKRNKIIKIKSLVSKLLNKIFFSPVLRAHMYVDT